MSPASAAGFFTTEPPGKPDITEWLIMRRINPHTLRHGIAEMIRPQKHQLTRNVFSPKYNSHIIKLSLDHRSFIVSLETGEF